MSLIDLLTTGGSGAIFGSIGSVVGEAFSFFRKGQANKHELALLELEAKLEAQRHDQDVETAEIAERVLGDMAGHQAYIASVQHDAALVGTSQWVQNFRALTRPMLTWQTWLFLWVLLYAALFYTARVAAAMEIDMVRYLVETFIFSGAGFTAWWFGERMFSKRRAQI